MTLWYSLSRKALDAGRWFYRPRLERLEDRTVPSFLVAGSYPAGKEPESVAADDFNGDGTLDVAVATYLDNSVNVLLGNGDGSFQNPTSYTVGMYADAVVAGDFNADGIPDLAVARFSSPIGKVSVLLGNGDGTFQVAVDYSVSPDPVSLAVGDFNGDGIQDLAVGTTGMVSILLGNGDGAFQHAGDYKNGEGNFAGGAAVTVADLNGDGFQDIAVANYLVGNTVSVLLGNGDGTFGAAKSYPAGYDPEGLAAADFNGSGTVDLAVADYGANSLSVLMGNGDGSFQAPVMYDVGTHPIAVAIGDWNGDGVTDLAVANAVGISNTVHTLLGNGDGSFQSADSYDAGKSPNALAVGDFNADGAADLVTADYFGNTVTVLLNGNDWEPGPPTAVYSGRLNGRQTLEPVSFLDPRSGQVMASGCQQKDLDNVQLADLDSVAATAAPEGIEVPSPATADPIMKAPCSPIVRPNEDGLQIDLDDPVAHQ
jgi:hypothetical protein